MENYQLEKKKKYYRDSVGRQRNSKLLLDEVIDALVNWMMQQEKCSMQTKTL